MHTDTSQNKTQTTNSARHNYWSQSTVMWA